MQYGILSQRSEAYLADIWSELDDLYAGGYAMQAHAAKYLPILAGENPMRYEDRKKCAAYIGYLGQIIDYFTSSLFSQELNVAEAVDAKDATTAGGVADKTFWPAFAHDADLAGNAFTKVERKVFLKAALKKRGILALDFPLQEEASAIQSRADEEKIGTSRGYVFEVPVEQLINWKVGKFGGFQWAILYRCYVPDDVPLAPRDVVRHEWKVWEMAGGFATWTMFVKEKKPNEGFTSDEDVPAVAPPAKTSFTSIPLVELEVPEGLWVGNKIGCLAREHYQRRSQLVNAENRSMLSIPWIKRGPEINGIGLALPSETQQNPNRGADPVSTFQKKGWVGLGSDDDIGFAEPEGKAYALVNDQLKELKDEMFRVVHQMAASVDNSAGTMRRSGDSKKQDRAAESIVLGAFGQLIRDHAKKSYDVLSAGRGEKVVWTPHGLDKFETDARMDLIQEAMSMATIPIPSKTFWQTYKTQIALKLIPNAPPETQKLITDEIIDGVTGEEDLRVAVQDQDQKVAEQDPPPPGQKPGFGKAA